LPKAPPRPGAGTQPSTTQATAIEDVNRYASSRNDDIADM
jgi:hypothetical protein